MIFGIVQGNSVVGDIQGNLEKIKQYTLEGEKKSVEVIIFPELFLTGYPPEDLLYNPLFLREVSHALQELRKFSENISSEIVIGTPTKALSHTDTGSVSKSSLYNSAVVFHKGRKKTEYHKVHLPNYGVFDEKR